MKTTLATPTKQSSPSLHTFAPIGVRWWPKNARIPLRHSTTHGHPAPLMASRSVVNWRSYKRSAARSMLSSLTRPRCCILSARCIKATASWRNRWPSTRCDQIPTRRGIPHSTTSPNNLHNARHVAMTMLPTADSRAPPPCTTSPPTAPSRQPRAVVISPHVTSTLRVLRSH